MKKLIKNKGFSTVTAYLKLMEIANSAGASSRLTRKDRGKDLGMFSIKVSEFTQEFIESRLKKKNRLNSKQNIKYRMIRSDAVRYETKRARRRAFYLSKFFFNVYLYQ